MPFKKKTDLRKNRRVSICRLVKIRFPKATDASAITNLVDLSESGMRFHVTDLSVEGFQLSAPGLQAEEPAFKAFSGIKKGDTLLFRMKLDPDHPEIAVLGRLAWVKRESVVSGVRLRAGIQFLDVSDADLKMIQVYVSAFQ